MVKGKDSIKLNLKRAGDSITGIYHNLHYGIDQRRSTFKGILKGKEAVAISKYNAEGQDYIEELRFVIEDHEARLNYGPVEQDKEGIWRYKPGETLSEHVLPEISCK